MRTVGAVQGLLLALVVAFTTTWAQAQTYPTRPIRIQTAGAGGGADTTARLVASEISAPLGQQVIVENRPAGVPLMMGVAKSAPDGYTLLVVGGVIWTSSLFEEVPYDPVRDFAPIAMVVRTPTILMVHPTLPIKTVGDLVKLAKAKPGELNYSTGSTGSATHIAGALFASMADANIVRIAYKDQAQETADLLSGRVQMTVGSAPSMAPLISAGKLRPLATSGAKRSALYPDLPTIAETLPGYEAEQLTSLFAPAKTPEPIIRRLNQETVRALEKAEVKERLFKSGQEPVGGPPENLVAVMKGELARLTKVFKSAGVKPGS